MEYRKMKQITLIALCAIALFSCKKDTTDPKKTQDSALIGIWVNDSLGQPKGAFIDTLFITADKYTEKSIISYYDSNRKYIYSQPPVIYEKRWKTVSDTLCVLDGGVHATVVILRSLYKITGASLHMTQLYAGGNMPISYMQTWYHKK